jgi:hypothetical protein
MFEKKFSPKNALNSYLNKKLPSYLQGNSPHSALGLTEKQKIPVAGNRGKYFDDTI